MIFFSYCGTYVNCRTLEFHSGSQGGTGASHVQHWEGESHLCSVFVETAHVAGFPSGYFSTLLQSSILYCPLCVNVCNICKTLISHSGCFRVLYSLE